MVTTENLNIDYSEAFKFLVEKIKGKGFESISGRLPKNADPEMDYHVKIVSVGQGVEVCLKECIGSDKYDAATAEDFQHDFQVLTEIFASESVKPVRLLGIIDQVMVMENVDELAPVFQFLIKNRHMISAIHEALARADMLLEKAEKEKVIRCHVEPLVNMDFRTSDLDDDKKLFGIKRGKIFEHGFIRSYDADTGKFEIVFIDPVQTAKIPNKV